MAQRPVEHHRPMPHRLPAGARATSSSTDRPASSAFMTFDRLAEIFTARPVYPACLYGPQSVPNRLRIDGEAPGNEGPCSKGVGADSRRAREEPVADVADTRRALGTSGDQHAAVRGRLDPCARAHRLCSAHRARDRVAGVDDRSAHVASRPRGHTRPLLRGVSGRDPGWDRAGDGAVS
jgi:hypothetical protein